MMEMDSGWIIKAIEEAADRRAFNRIALSENFQILGLKIKQIARLAEFYETHTGRPAHQIEE